MTLNANVMSVKLEHISVKNTPKHPWIPLVFKMKCAIALLWSDNASYLLCSCYCQGLFFFSTIKFLTELTTSSPEANHSSVPLPVSPPQVVMETHTCPQTIKTWHSISSCAEQQSYIMYRYLKKNIYIYIWTHVVWDSCQKFAGVSARVTTPSGRTLVSPTTMRDTMMTQWHIHTTRRVGGDTRLTAETVCSCVLASPAAHLMAKSKKK